MLKLIRDLKSLLHEDIIRRNKVTPFFVFTSMIVSFFISRLLVTLFPGVSLFIKEYHIHHYYYGIFLVCISAWTALVSNKISLLRISAVMFGLGLGMILDEFGLLLTCGTYLKECDYWHRISYDTFIITCGVFLSIMYFGPVWKKIKKIIRKKEKSG
ncbi:hypothetical protein JW949_02000 [Candidatus Woesearchaeota archaeon]|nr:hypothetical protein [Candidatus Woesearchaeota archaeon]